MKKLLLIISLMFYSHSAWSWEVWQEESAEHTNVAIAEVVGDTGSFLQLVCIDQNIHVEVVFLGATASQKDTMTTFQVDDSRLITVAGFLESLPEEDLSVFIGLDRRGRPAPTTQELVQHMLKGHHLYALDANTQEPAEHWSMAGSIKAVRLLTELCSIKTPNTQSI